MAVRVIPRSHARSPLQVITIAPAVLGLALIAPALDLLMLVQPGPTVSYAAVLASAATAAALLLTWIRFPRTSWLFAAALATVASLGMRLLGADVAPFVGLLSIVGLGVGGAFRTPDVSPEVA
jgi:hypothetical protein